MNILIIDDESIVLRTLERYIKFRGDTALVASNGRDGLGILDAHAVDLVITDVNMPDIDGLEVLQAVSQKNPDIPVIIVTAYADTDMAIRAVNQGAFAFLQKPLLADHLGKKIDAAMVAIQARQDERTVVESLKQTAAEQRQQLIQEQAFSAAIIRNVPFPVCLIGERRRIYMANASFREIFMPDVELGAGGELGEDLQTVLPDFPLEKSAVSEEGITLEAKDGKGAQRFFNIKSFAVDTPMNMDMDMVCLLLQDITLEVVTEKERALRQWCIGQTYEFRDKTAALIHSGDMLPEMARLIHQSIVHFNPIHVQLFYEGQCHVAGMPGLEEPYLSEDLVFEGRNSARLSLFSSNPQQVEVQRDFVAQLAEIIVSRIEERQFQMHLLQSNQLRALGEMAAGVAHELNQPLSGIRTFAEGIVYGLHKDWDISKQELEETLQDIVGQVDRMSTIIDHMRTFARDGAVEEAVAFHLDEVINNVFKLVDTQLKVHGIETHFEISPDLGVCFGWPQQIEQVLLNLIVNARQAMDGQAKKQQEEGTGSWTARLEVRARPGTRDGEVQVEISDNGGGILPAQATKIFDPFFTSKEVGEGTGLGLSISRTIVTRHKGRIEVDNRPGTGVTFIVILPTAELEVK